MIAVPVSPPEHIAPSRASSRPSLGKLCHHAYASAMTTMNVSLPEELKSFIDAQVDTGGYGSTSEYVRELIREARDRDRLRSALLEGATSPVAATAGDYIDTLRTRIERP